ncbi:helix-turn-helix transcriptional regulator [Lysobacter sp. GCM10012299]|uniref:helix-turn-helix transcriptional regulator n=1 Tax=Lysobacter sp. GCM10012299 TaxID=3317333 RepID=UPI003620805C
MSRRELVILKGKGDQPDRIELEESDLPMLAKAMEMAQQNSSYPSRLLKLEEVEALVGLKKSAIYQRVKEGSFPPPVSVKGTTAKRWREGEVAAWIEDATAS